MAAFIFIKKITMKRFLILIFIILANITNAQTVANFSTGTPGNNDFEEFSFWANHEITYTYGSKWKQLNIIFTGITSKNSFTVQFPNRHSYKVIVEASSISVIGLTTEYRKVMGWHYEGPINGIGTYCSVCTQSAEDAVKLLKKKYLK